MEFGITQGIVALLVIAAAIIPFILKRKQVWPFKPRLKKINEKQDEFEGDLDKKLDASDWGAYLDSADRVIDKRERLRQQKKSDDKADK